MEMEERRRELAHRLVRQQRRLRLVLWSFVGIGLLATVILTLRLAGFVG